MLSAKPSHISVLKNGNVLLLRPEAKSCLLSPCRPFDVICGSCHKYHFCRDKSMIAATKLLSEQNYVLSRQAYLFCRDKHKIKVKKKSKSMFVATNICRNKRFVTTKMCLSRRHKHTFFATKDILCRVKHVFVATNTYLQRQNLRRDKNDTCASSRQ